MFRVNSFTSSQGSVVSEEDHIQEYQDRLKRETEMAGGGLKVAAFNIQIFGVTKYSMEEVIGNLSRVRSLLAKVYLASICVGWARIWV